MNIKTRRKHPYNTISILEAFLSSYSNYTVIHWFFITSNQDEVNCTFPSRFFLEDSRFGQKYLFSNQQKQTIFFIANERDLIHQYRRRRLQKKPLQCKKFFKIKQNRPESLAQKNEKRKFSFYLNKK